MDSQSALAPYRNARRVALAALVITTSGLLASGPSLQTVRLVVENGVTSVILSADGALPSPKVGVLIDPPRIYLDFPDVAAATEGIRAHEDLLVRGVRVAVNQSRPLVTRVVIDLARPTPYRIEAGQRASGQLTIVIGVRGALASADAPAKAPATVPAVPAAAPAARTLPVASRPSLQTVRLVDVGNGEASVLLSADGALPSPEVGVLADPPGIYLDFPGIVAATEGIRVNGDLLVRSVRVAVNQSQPLVTRVVIDLARPTPYRIEAGQRASGQLTIVVGVRGAPAGADAPAKAPATVPAVPAEAPAALRPAQAGEPAARAARSPEFARATGATAARTPAKDVAQYLQRASSLLERLERLRPLLVSLDALADLPEAQLKAAAQEFESIRRALATILPPHTVAATHEVFRDVCVLGAASAAARLAPAAPDDSARAWNAAAAAAGAIMLLDRAWAEVGLAACPRAASDSVVPVIVTSGCASTPSSSC
jgi:hypothetical protein